MENDDSSAAAATSSTVRWPKYPGSKLDKWYRNYYFQKEAKRQGKRTVFALKAIKIIIVMRSKPH